MCLYKVAVIRYIQFQAIFLLILNIIFHIANCYIMYDFSNNNIPSFRSSSMTYLGYVLVFHDYT